MHILVYIYSVINGIFFSLNVLKCIGIVLVDCNIETQYFC